MKSNGLDAVQPPNADSAVTTTQLDKAKETESYSIADLKPKSIIGIRHLQCLLVFLALAVIYALRVNMSLAIVAMTDNDTNSAFGIYPWTEQTQSIILSSFFWGHVITQIPGGQLAQRYGAKYVIFYGITICAVLNILTPCCAKMGGWPLVCALRVLQGLCQGTIYPSTHTLLSKWAPVEERGKLGTFSYAGTQFGTALTMAIGGELASSSMGWPSIFYFTGGAGIVWAVFWFFFASSSPEENRFISEEEKKFIMTSLGNVLTDGEKKPKFPTPWRDILLSGPFLVLLVSQCAHNWGFWTLTTEIPTYLKNVFGMDIKKNALVSALPYLVMTLLGFFFIFISEMLNKAHCMSLNFSRKFFNSVGLWLPMIGLIGLGYIDGDDTTLAIVLLSATVGLISGCYLGYQMNHIDLSPNFAGTLMGISNCAASIISILAPLAVGFIVHDETDPVQWRIVFFIAAGIFFVGNLLFVVFGKTSPQYWNEPKENQSGKTENNSQNPVSLESQN